MNFYKKSSGKNPEDFFSPYLTLADEATASVDPENEHLIQAAISELTKGKTIIAIAYVLLHLISKSPAYCFSQLKQGTYLI